MVEVNPIFQRIAKDQGFLSEGLMEQLATDGTLAALDDVPDDVRRVFVCAHDVSPNWHMRMQAALQRHCDSSISKTINFAETATVEDVEKIYQLAYELRCKGVTVYRNGCRKMQPMALKSSDTSGTVEKSEAKTETPPPPLEPATLPEIQSAIRVRQMTPFGNMHINITVDPLTERELEVFAQLGKGGDLANSDLEAICRMISLWLRSGGTLDHVIRQLHSIGSSLQVHTKEGRIMSLGDGLARGLRKYLDTKFERGLTTLLTAGRGVEAEAKVGTNGGNGKDLHRHRSTCDNGNGKKELTASVTKAVPNRLDAVNPQIQHAQYKVLCPECQHTLRFGEGCVTCDSCGFSRC